MKQVWIKQGSKVFGPTDLKQVKALLLQNRLDVNQQFSESENGPWLPAAQAKFLAILTRDANSWYWLKTGWADDSREGPLTGGNLIRLLDEKKIKSKTAVFHPLFTGNDWMKISDTLLQVVYEAILKQREIARQQKLEQERLEAEQERQRREQIRQVEAEAQRLEEARQREIAEEQARLVEEARQHEQQQLQLVPMGAAGFDSSQVAMSHGDPVIGGSHGCWYCGCAVGFVTKQCPYCRMLV